MLKKKNIREIAIAGGILLILLGYIIFRPSGRVRYQLPKVESFEVAAIDRVTIEQPTVLLEVRREGDKWLSEPHKFPLDEGILTPLFELLAEPEFLDMVSDSSPYDRFLLGEEQRITVTAYSAEDEIRQFLLGGSAGGGRSTYALLPDGKKVYTLKGDVSDLVSSTIGDLRDKNVLQLNRDTVTAISVSGMANEEFTKENDIWKTSDGEEWPIDKINDVLSRLSNLRCDAFSADPPEGETSTITLTGSEGTVVLTIANEQTGSGYRATVTGYDFPFVLPSYTVETLLGDFTGE